VVYKKGKNNLNADALSRIEIHNEESISMIANPSERPPSPNGSTTATAHTSQDNPILEIPMTDEPLNKYHRQIILNIVENVTRRPIITKPIETHTRVVIQLTHADLENHLINAIKEYVNPKVQTGLLITPPLAIYQIVPILQDKFRSSEINFSKKRTRKC
jgi:hypothetical protein